MRRLYQLVVIEGIWDGAGASGLGADAPLLMESDAGTRGSWGDPHLPRSTGGAPIVGWFQSKCEA